jgi:uncharacterized protein (DUF2147 family)
MLHRFSVTTRHSIFSGILLSAGLVSATLAPALAADDPTGDWRVADGVANIRVAECNGSMWGAVAWEQTPGGLDKNNPDASKRSRPTLGMPILIDMKKNSTGDKWAGQVYNAKDGKFYKSTIKLDGTDELEIQGCVLGFLCGGETWTRVGPPIPSSPSNLAKGAAAPAGTKPGIIARITGNAPKAAAPTTPAPASAPKTGPTTAAAAPKAVAGQKTAAAQPADIGDICLLPEIARPAH